MKDELQNIKGYSANPTDQYERRIISLENEVRNLSISLSRYYLSGRLRVDRTAPADSDAVTAGIDFLYDRIVTSSYEYILIPITQMDLSIKAQWVRIGVSTF